jgi:hypothetical protein
MHFQFAQKVILFRHFVRSVYTSSDLINLATGIISRSSLTNVYYSNYNIGTVPIRAV